MAIFAIGAACGKAPDDSQLTSQIQSKLNEDSGLQGKPIQVQTAGGVVTLSGTVDNDAERTAASRYAASIPGTKQVVNDLAVRPAPTAAIAPADQMNEEPAPEATKPAAKPRPSVPVKKAKPTQTAMVSSEPQQTQMHSERSLPAEPPASATPPTPPPPKKLTLAAGTTMAVRLTDGLSSETTQPGQSFRATLDSPLASEGETAIPAGYNIEGHVVDVKSAGKFSGKSELILQLDRITVGSKTYNIETDQYKREGSSRTVNTAEKVGAGAAIGAIIGGIAGGGKGAGIGAAAGGGLGGGVQAATKGQQIKLPAETVLNFTLQSPLTVSQMSEGPNANRPRLQPPQ